MDAFEHTMHTLSTTVSNWSEERLHITQHMPNIRCASMCDVSFIVFFQQNPISMSQWLVICLFYVYLRVYNHKLALLCNQFSSFMSIMSEILHNLVIYSKIIRMFLSPHQLWTIVHGCTDEKKSYSFNGNELKRKLMRTLVLLLRSCCESQRQCYHGSTIMTTYSLFGFIYSISMHKLSTGANYLHWTREKNMV